MSSKLSNSRARAPSSVVGQTTGNERCTELSKKWSPRFCVSTLNEVLSKSVLSAQEDGQESEQEPSVSVKSFPIVRREKPTQRSEEK